MSKKEKGRKWDGKSRVSNDLYRKNFETIFGKKIDKNKVLFMPLYEYRCSTCGHECEQLESVNSPKRQICPKCQANELNRVVSRTHFKLTGSGWYETDFKDKPTKPAAKNESSKNDTSPSNSDD